MLQKTGVLIALKTLNEKELTSAVPENTGNFEHYFLSVQRSLSSSHFRSCSKTNSINFRALQNCYHGMFLYLATDKDFQEGKYHNKNW